MKQFTLLLDDDLYDEVEKWSHEHDRTFSESLRHGLRMFFLPATPPEKAPRGRIPFQPPTVESIAQYCIEKGYDVDAEEFHAFYESKGWRVGNQPMRSWTAACLTWHKRGANGKAKNGKPPTYTGIPSPSGSEYQKTITDEELKGEESPFRRKP